MFMTRFAINCGLVSTSKKCKKFPEIKFFSKLTISDFGSQIGLCLNSLAMGVWGWWAFDLFALIASYMSKETFAAQTFMRSIGLMTFMLPVGIAQACGTLIGNAIG